MSIKFYCKSCIKPLVIFSKLPPPKVIVSHHYLYLLPMVARLNLQKLPQTRTKLFHFNFGIRQNWTCFYTRQNITSYINTLMNFILCISSTFNHYNFKLQTGPPISDVSFLAYQTLWTLAPKKLTLMVALTSFDYNSTPLTTLMLGCMITLLTGPAFIMASFIGSVPYASSPSPCSS